MKKRRYCPRDLNPVEQDGWRTQIHWAMSAFSAYRYQGTWRVQLSWNYTLLTSLKNNWFIFEMVNRKYLFDSFKISKQHFQSSSFQKSWIILSRLLRPYEANSVTRLGEILPYCQSCTCLWRFIAGLFTIWQNSEPH